MENIINIAGYCRISVDEEMDRENTSIENQKSIIEDFVRRKFPNANLDFYDDRDRSGYTFEQREGYQVMRKKLMSLDYDILVVKDFSRFARRNSRGLVELEDLRDAGVRIIAIGDNIDYPTYDDWTAIQFRFLINEMPVTDTSKKVKSVIKRRQSEGKWICSVPYGYVITNSKAMTFEVDEASADVVRKIFALYNEGSGYKKIANYLTDEHIPTPRMCEKMRKEANCEEYRAKVRPEWSIITVSEILSNDFYIGTLRQGKYKRKKINGSDIKTDETDHIVFENNHEPIVDFRTFAITQEQLKKRSVTNYRGVKKYANVYSGFLFCGDCGSPMFSMSRRDLALAYTCGTYHRRGTNGCSSHHTRVDMLDRLLKAYVKKVKDNSAGMIERLNQSIKDEKEQVKDSTTTLEMLTAQIEDIKLEMKMLARQKARELMRSPEKENVLDEMYDEMQDELADRIDGLHNQIELTANRKNAIIRVNRTAKTAIEIFDDILKKDNLDKLDLELIIEKIVVYEDHLEIKLKSDIDSLLSVGTLGKAVGDAALGVPFTEQIVQSAKNRLDKVLSVNVISNGDPLEIFTDREGEIILKKYSPIGELGAFAKEYAESLAQTAGHITCIVDKDQIIAVSGGAKKELLEKHISASLEKTINSRNTVVATRAESGFVSILDDEVEGMYNHELISPIISEGDVLGAVVFLSPDKKMGDLESKLAQTAAGFLGKQMEQ